MQKRLKNTSSENNLILDRSLPLSKDFTGRRPTKPRITIIVDRLGFGKSAEHIVDWAEQYKKRCIILLPR